MTRPGTSSTSATRTRCTATRWRKRPGTLVMRFADADVLPYDFTNLAATLKGYTTELKALEKQMMRDAAARKTNLDLGAYTLAADPERPVKAPGPLTTPPALDFSALDSALTTLTTAADSFNQARLQMGSTPPGKLARINAELALAERKFLNAQGLPRRPWVEHLLYAPGVYTGYGAKTMPGVREALEQERYTEAAEQLVILTSAVQSEAAYIESIAGEMRGQ